MPPPPPTHTVMSVSGEATDEDPRNGPATQDDVEEEPLPNGDPGTILQVKHLDEILDLTTGKWNVRPTPATVQSKQEENKYSCFAFTVVRRFLPSGNNGRNGQASYTVTKLIDIQSEHLRKIGGEVIGPTQSGVSWTAKPLRVNFFSFDANTLLCDISGHSQFHTQLVG